MADACHAFPFRLAGVRTLWSGPVRCPQLFEDQLPCSALAREEKLFQRDPMLVNHTDCHSDSESDVEHSHALPKLCAAIGGGSLLPPSEDGALQSLVAIAMTGTLRELDQPRAARLSQLISLHAPAAADMFVHISLGQSPWGTAQLTALTDLVRHVRPVAWRVHLRAAVGASEGGCAPSACVAADSDDARLEHSVGCYAAHKRCIECDLSKYHPQALRSLLAYHLIANHEQRARRGASYRFIVATRVDAHSWMVPSDLHPLMSHLLARQKSAGSRATRRAAAVSNDVHRHISRATAPRLGSAHSQSKPQVVVLERRYGGVDDNFAIVPAALSRRYFSHIVTFAKCHEREVGVEACGTAVDWGSWATPECVLHVHLRTALPEECVDASRDANPEDEVDVVRTVGELRAELRAELQLRQWGGQEHGNVASASATEAPNVTQVAYVAEVAPKVAKGAQVARPLQSLRATSLVRESAMRPLWAEEGSCGEFDEEVLSSTCALQETRGTWHVWSLASCFSSCVACPSCRYLSYSPTTSYCRWYAECHSSSHRHDSINSSVAAATAATSPIRGSDPAPPSVASPGSNNSSHADAAAGASAHSTHTSTGAPASSTHADASAAAPAASAASAASAAPPRNSRRAAGGTTYRTWQLRSATGSLLTNPPRGCRSFLTLPLSPVASVTPPCTQCMRRAKREQALFITSAPLAALLATPPKGSVLLHATELPLTVYHEASLPQLTNQACGRAAHASGGKSRQGGSGGDDSSGCHGSSGYSGGHRDSNRDAERARAVVNSQPWARDVCTVDLFEVIPGLSQLITSPMSCLEAYYRLAGSLEPFGNLVSASGKILVRKVAAMMHAATVMPHAAVVRRSPALLRLTSVNACCLRALSVSLPLALAPSRSLSLRTHMHLCDHACLPHLRRNRNHLPRIRCRTGDVARFRRGGDRRRCCIANVRAVC